MENMFDKIKALFRKDERDPEEILHEARIRLLESRKEYLNIIDTELRNIRYNRDHAVRDTDDEHSMTVIKNALFGVSLIDRTQRKLNEAHTVKQLFNAMNITTEALNLVNRAMKKSPSPGGRSFVSAVDRFKTSSDRDRELLVRCSSRSRTSMRSSPMKR